MPPVCPLCHEPHDAGTVACVAHSAPTRVLGTEPAAAAPSESGDPLIGRLLAERYRVQRLIGEGGMGRVYLAEHERMGRLSAVKVMSPTLAATPEAVSRFHREAANASRIHQPNVAAIYDFGETDDGMLYLAMEYVEGETLSGVIQRDGPLPPVRAAAIASQVADGLQAAHHLGIVHRDLKPDNILITRHHDGREWVKIVDFGIAKQTRQHDQTVTSLGVAIGTPEYMSPEQIAGEALDARTDLYSLGLVMFTMLTGQLPHPAMTSKQSMILRLTARPRTLAEVAPNKVWSPRLQKALERALAPEPDDRYASVGDFARDLQAAVALSMVGGAAASAMTPTHPADVALAASNDGRGGSGVLLACAVVLLVGGGLATLGRDGIGRTVAGLTRHRTAVVPPTPAVTVADSGSTDLPVVLASRGDSGAAPPAGTPALSPLAPGQQLERAALQSGRRAGGAGADSGSAETHVAAMQTAEDDTREIMVHVNRARELTRGGKLQGAGLELRTSYEEYLIFLTEHASAPQVETLRGNLQVAMDEALDACRAARAADVAGGGKGFRCEHPAKTGLLVVYDEAPSASRVTP